MQLSRHHGRAANRVRWITGTEFFICENECMATARLEKQNEGYKTRTLVLMCEVKAFDACSSDLGWSVYWFPVFGMVVFSQLHTAFSRIVKRYIILITSIVSPAPLLSDQVLRTAPCLCSHALPDHSITNKAFKILLCMKFPPFC